MQRKIGNTHGFWLALYNLGGINLERQNYDMAGTLFRESLGICMKQNAKTSIALTLESIAYVLGTNNSLGSK